MNLRTIIENKNITMYKLSKISGIPQTTINDICSGKSVIGNCKADTVLRLAKALECSMEEIMNIDSGKYDEETGLPKNKLYLECGLPSYLNDSLGRMKKSWEIVDRGEKDLHWDLCWDELNADINCAEVDNEISSEQAGYLRRVYLRMENNT